PAGVAVTGASISDGQVNGGVLQFSLGTLAAATTGMVSFTVQVSANVANGTTLVNQAQIGGPGLAQPVPSNSVSTTVVAPTFPPPVPPPTPTGSPLPGRVSSLPT